MLLGQVIEAGVEPRPPGSVVQSRRFERFSPPANAAWISAGRRRPVARSTADELAFFEPVSGLSRRA
jgi:hypothetical protein